MPEPADVQAATEQPDQAADQPNPIVVHSSTFDLKADPAALVAAAASVRALGLQALSAQNTVDAAGRLIEAEESWLGETADSFQDHRRSLVTGLSDVGGAAGRAAGTLDYIATTLQLGQARLDEQKARLAGISFTERTETPAEPHPAVLDGPRLVYQPRNADEATLIADAEAAAEEIRAYVDEQLALQRAALQRILTGPTVPDPRVGNDPGLNAVANTWRPQAVRYLSFNIGQGYGNVPFDARGTDPGDIDEIGRIIADSDANVIGLQEVFHPNAHGLVGWLNDNTDSTWQLHFEKADRKLQSDDGWFRDTGYHDFGNAVLVRQDDGVGDIVEREPTQLQEPGWGDYVDTEWERSPHQPPSPDVDVGSHPEGRSMQHTEIPLERGS